MVVDYEQWALDMSSLLDAIEIALGNAASGRSLTTHRVSLIAVWNLNLM